MNLIKISIGLIFVFALMMQISAQSGGHPVWPQNTHTVGQWRCMHLGLACANLGSWGQFHSYLHYDDNGNFLNYREDVVVNSTKDQLPYIRELLTPTIAYEYFFTNSSVGQLSCFVRNGLLIWPSDWLANATYLGVRDFHGVPCDAYKTVFHFFGIPTADLVFVDIATGMYAGWQQTTGGLEYQWFTYSALTQFPTPTFFDGPSVTAPCSTLSQNEILPWRS